MLIFISAAKIQLVLSDRFNDSGAIDVEMDKSIFKEKLSFKIFGLFFISKLN